MNTKLTSYNRVSDDKCYTSAVEPINLKISLDCARSLIAPFLRSLAQCELDYDLSGFHTPASLSARDQVVRPTFHWRGGGSARYLGSDTDTERVVSDLTLRMHCDRLRRYLVRLLPAGVSADTLCTVDAAIGKSTKGVRSTTVN